MPRETIDRDVNMSDGLAKLALLTDLGPLQGAYAVEVKPIDPRRGNGANRYYWGAVIETLRKYFAQQGETKTKDELHALLGNEFRRVNVCHPVTKRPMGVTMESTAAMSAERFSEYIDQCTAYLADWGIVVPPRPDYGTTATAGATRR